METKESKAMLEVWEWKNKASEELLKIPEGERIAYLKKKTSAVIAKLNLRKGKLQPIIR
ncbi:MAG: hypothetical protein ABI855_09765 [Bacteroidota bacterium]